MNKDNRSKIINIILFIVYQLCIALYCMYLLNLFSIVEIDTLSNFFIILFFYLLIFILPIYIYIRFYEKTKILMFLKLDNKIFGNIGLGFIIGFLIIFIWIIMNKYNFRILHLSESVILMIIGNMFVGILEEIPFRGFYLQMLNNYFNFWTSNIITSVMFVLIHIPSLLINGSQIIITCFSLFIISMWMGYIFNKTQSLWIVIVLHSIYNLIILFIKVL